MNKGPEVNAEGAGGGEGKGRESYALAEQVLQQWDQRGSDEDHTATAHELLDALASGTGVLAAIALQKVDGAPDTEAGTDGNHYRLKQ